MLSLSRGERVRMSKLGAARCPRIAGKSGVVIGTGHYPDVIRVLFDNSKSPVSLHKKYLEKVATELDGHRLAPPLRDDSFKVQVASGFQEIQPDFDL